jgi:hypothetical protein
MSIYKWANPYGGEWENTYNWRDADGNTVYQYPGQYSGQGDIVYFDYGSNFFVYSNNPFSDLHLQAVYFSNSVTNVDFRQIRFAVDTAAGLSSLIFGKDPSVGDTSVCSATFGDGTNTGYNCKLIGPAHVFQGEGFSATISSNYGEVDQDVGAIRAVNMATLVIQCALSGTSSLTVEAQDNGTNLTVAGTVTRPSMTYRTAVSAVLHFATVFLGTGGVMQHAGGTFDFMGQSGIPWTAFTQMIMGGISLQGIASGEEPVGKGVSWQLLFDLAPYVLSPYMIAGDSLLVRQGGRLNMVQDDTLACNLAFTAGEQGIIKYFS